MQLYSSLTGYNKVLMPHHHIKLPLDAIMDLRIWLTFLRSPLTYSWPFIDYKEGQDAVTLDWYTDAAKSAQRGYGGHHMSHWFYGQWDTEFFNKYDPSIEYLQLYALTAGVLLWLKNHKNQ